MNRSNGLRKFAILLTPALAMALSGCFGPVNRRGYDMSPKVWLTGTQTPSGASGATSGGSADNGGYNDGYTTLPTSGGGAAEPDPVGTDPLITETIDSTGYTSHAFTVQANKVLKVQFTPNWDDGYRVYANGQYYGYSALMVFVKVGSTEKSTGLLASGFYGSAQDSNVLDFKGAFTNTCGSDDSCRNSVSVTIHKPNYNFYCLNFPWSAQCYSTPGWSHVYDTHDWGGTVTIQTDDTVAIQ